MGRPFSPIPAQAEIRALRFLHEHGPSNVREYFEKGGLDSEGLAYTSAMSIMFVLHQQKLATRIPEGRGFRYTAAISSDELRQTTLSHVLDHVFGGSAAELKSTLAHLEQSPKRQKKAVRKW